MKSSYELAMERLSKQAPAAKVTNAQKGTKKMFARESLESP